MLERLRGRKPILFRDLVGEEIKAADIATREVIGLKESDRFEEALKLVLSGYRVIPVTDSSGKSMQGFITSKEVLDFLGAGPLSKKAEGKLVNSKVSLLMDERVSIPVGERNTASSIMDSFREHDVNMHHLERKGVLSGIITKSDITYRIRKNTGLRVRDVMTEDPFFVRDEDRLSDVAKMLARGPFRKLPVIRDGFIVGIVTPFDVISYLNGKKKLSQIGNAKDSVSKAMNAFVAKIEPDADVSEAVALMRRKNISGLPVTDEGILIGIITESDIIEAMR